jgi:hypothetical protein
MDIRTTLASLIKEAIDELAAAEREYGESLILAHRNHVAAKQDAYFAMVKACRRIEAEFAKSEAA